MWRLGSPRLGRVLTGTVLVPFPMFWALIGAGRLFARSELSFAQTLVWVILMPLLVLISLLPLLKNVLIPTKG